VWSWAQLLSNDEIKSHPHSAHIVADNVTSFAYHVQIGMYSQSSSILGISQYTISNVSIQVVAGVISLVMGKWLGGLLAEGLSYLITSASVRLLTFLAEVGVESAAIYIPAALISFVAFSICSMLVFIGVLYFLNWLLRKYTLIINIYNWDTQNVWNTLSTDYESNAEISGDGSVYRSMSLPKAVNSGSIILPPGFGPIVTLNNIVAYGTLVYNNKSVWAGGLDMAICCQQENNSQNNFAFKYTLPRLSHNQLYGSPTTLPVDLKSFFGNNQWFNGTSGSCTVAGTPVSFLTDYLSGAPNELYTTTINISSTF